MMKSLTKRSNEKLEIITKEAAIKKPSQTGSMKNLIGQIKRSIKRMIFPRHRKAMAVIYMSPRTRDIQETEESRIHYIIEIGDIPKPLHMEMKSIIETGNIQKNQHIQVMLLIKEENLMKHQNTVMKNVINITEIEKHQKIRNIRWTET